MSKHQLKVFDKFLQVFYYFVMVMSFVMAVIICWEIISRQLFNAPTIWAMDASRYMLVYITWFGAPLILITGGHVKAELLTSRLSSRNQRTLSIVTAIIGAIFTLSLAVFTGINVWRNFILGTPVIDVLEFPYWVTIVPIPIGSLLLCLAFLRSIIRK